MAYFRNPAYRGRLGDCMQVVAAVAPNKPAHGLNGQPFEWEPAAGPAILDGLDKLGVVAGVAFYGYL